MTGGLLAVLVTLAQAAPAAVYQLDGPPPLPVPPVERRDVQGQPMPPAPPPEPSKPIVITLPTWERKPTGEDIARVFPKRAQREDVAGSATMSCQVMANGRLTACEVMAENPSGYGFGDAALSLAEAFKLPALVNGQPVEGGTVRIPIRFTFR